MFSFAVELEALTCLPYDSQVQVLLQCAEAEPTHSEFSKQSIQLSNNRTCIDSHAQQKRNPLLQLCLSCDVQYFKLKHSQNGVLGCCIDHTEHKGFTV